MRRLHATQDASLAAGMRPLASSPRRQLPLPLAGLALAAWMCSTGYANDIVTIEEHWELTIGQPDVASSSPQVSMVTSPTGHLNGDYFVFTLNHHSAPAWSAGGLQVQHWQGDVMLASREGEDEELIHHAGEFVRWVQRTSLDNGNLVFEIVSGQSDSWESFGDVGYLRFTVPTNMTSLNGYSPGVSLRESGVCFAGNRVQSLTLRKLRWVDSTGQVFELNAPIDVDADLDP